MIYKVLSHPEVELLNEELRRGFPGTAKIFYVIESFLAGHLPGKEVIVDEWPQWTSIVIRTSNESEFKAQPFFRYTYMCHARSASALKYFLQRPDVINWRKPCVFTGVPRDVAPVISNLATKHLGRVNLLEPRFMYAWAKKELPTMPEVPEGLHLSKLTAEDAATLRKDWEGSRYREDLEGYFRAVIEQFESSCLRDERGDLLAYACMQFNGSIAMLYVKPEHRDKDYFKIVLSDLARTRLRKGEVAYGFIPTNDSDLVDQMRSLDFVWVPTGDMVWMQCEPLKVNRSNLPSLTSSAFSFSHSQDDIIDCVCSSVARVPKAADQCRREFGTQRITKSTEPTETLTTLVSQTS